MISHSSPIIPEMFNSESEILDDISFFAFPYFEDKPEYKDTHVVYTSGKRGNSKTGEIYDI